MRFILLHEFDDLPTSNEAVMLAYSKAIAAGKLCLVENVIFKCSIAKLLRKVMQEDSRYWKDFIFLDEMTL